MTHAEIIKRFKQTEEIKKDIPPIFNDVLKRYQLYLVERERNRTALNLLYYELEGVKAVDYTKEKHTYNKDAHIEKYYKISDQITELEKQNDLIESCIKGLEYIRDSIKDKALKQKVTQCYFYNVFE